MKAMVMLLELPINIFILCTAAIPSTALVGHVAAFNLAWRACHCSSHCTARFKVQLYSAWCMLVA
jgi:hypothetical protein